MLPVLVIREIGYRICMTRELRYTDKILLRAPQLLQSFSANSRALVSCLSVSISVNLYVISFGMVPLCSAGEHWQISFVT